MSDHPYSLQLQTLEQQLEQNRALLNDPELKDLAQQEILQLQKEKSILEQAALDFANQVTNKPINQLTSQPVNCIIEIRGGAGGDEAKLWGEELLRMYLRFAEKLKLKVEFIDDAIVKIKGHCSLGSAYQVFKFESGVHRVQRVPTTEAQGRIHTSTASVAVLPEVHPSVINIREEDLEWQFIRSGGAGGQSVNKTNSAVRLTHKPSGIMISARQERKQAQNRQIALELLRAQLWEIEEEAKQKQLGDARSAIGRQMRSEKIRTYNFPQNRLTDHRIHQSWHNLDVILEGNLETVVTAPALRAL